MAARFLKGTTMAALEADMQRIPGFGPRKSGIIRSQYSIRDMKCANCQMAEKRREADSERFYHDLIQRLADDLPRGAFFWRVMKLQEQSEMETLFFRNAEHRRRFRLLIKCGLFPGLQTDYGFAAAVFLLSADSRLWEQAAVHMYERGIDYKAFHVRGVDLDGYAIFCAAKELGTGRRYLTLSELGDAKLIHDGLLMLIIHGILISRHGIGIIYGEEEVY